MEAVDILVFISGYFLYYDNLDFRWNWTQLEKMNTLGTEGLNLLFYNFSPYSFWVFHPAQLFPAW